MVLIVLFLSLARSPLCNAGVVVCFQPNATRTAILRIFLVQESMDRLLHYAYYSAFFGMVLQTDGVKVQKEPTIAVDFMLRRYLVRSSCSLVT